MLGGAGVCVRLVEDVEHAEPQVDAVGQEVAHGGVGPHDSVHRTASRGDPPAHGSGRKTERGGLAGQGSDEVQLHHVPGRVAELPVVGLVAGGLMAPAQAAAPCVPAALESDLETVGCDVVHVAVDQQVVGRIDFL